jgi:hypothetical protein
MLGTVGTALADPSPATFATKANFSVDGTALALSNAIATIEPRAGAPGYSWLRIYFYAFAPTADDVAAARQGSVAAMERRWQQLAATPTAYNTGRAVVQLSVDQDFKVWQVDLSVPGHSCTIAPDAPDVQKFLQAYRFDGSKLRLKSARSFVCDLKFMKVPDQTYTWAIDLDTPVFAKAAGAK